jgi:hypothetical protein
MDLTNQAEINKYFKEAIDALRSPTHGAWNIAYGGSAPSGNDMSLGLAWPGGQMMPNANSPLYTNYPMMPNSNWFSHKGYSGIGGF